MIEGVPLYIILLFGITVLGAVLWVYTANRSTTFLLIALGWALIQSVVGWSGFYQKTETLPPRIMLFGVFPALLAIISILATKQGRTFLDNFHLQTLTYFHTIRIPVEIVLVLLFHQGLVSIYMTFEGTNFDLFSGITAPLVAYFAFRNARPRKTLLMGWNVICTLLLVNVVITAVFALPSPFQQLSIDQPNVAVLYFPFNLLPTVVVPLVLLALLTAFRLLLKKNNSYYRSQ